jgi:hypothetical protein
MARLIQAILLACVIGVIPWFDALLHAFQGYHGAMPTALRGHVGLQNSGKMNGYSPSREVPHGYADRRLESWR